MVAFLVSDYLPVSTGVGIGSKLFIVAVVCMSMQDLLLVHSTCSFWGVSTTLI